MNRVTVSRCWRQFGMQRNLLLPVLLGAILLPCRSAHGERGHHAVTLGAPRSVPYSPQADPAGSNGDENKLVVRPLVVDGHIAEWTTGPIHEVTDRSFVVRLAVRLNNALPGEKSGKNGDWIWQRGPWLLVDRVTGHAATLKLPDYDPVVSDVVWFRDDAAYCGLSASGKSLYAMVAQIATRKPLLHKKLQAYDAGHALSPVCNEAVWQRDPLSVTFQLAGGTAHTYALFGVATASAAPNSPAATNASHADTGHSSRANSVQGNPAAINSTRAQPAASGDSGAGTSEPTSTAPSSSPQH